jgi:membrane protein implicated in regulation of membrane protease activity
VINKLITVQRKITRKTYGAVRTDDGYWRIKTSQEINDIIKD